MITDEMLRRTKQFAIDCGHLVSSLEVNAVNRVYGGQLIRSGSSVGANYRAHERQNQHQILLISLKL